MRSFLKRSVAWFLLAALYAAPAFASCDLFDRVVARRLTTALASSEHPERQLLSQFNPKAALGENSVDVLSPESGVFRIRSGNGADYVVRLPSLTHDVGTEKFASAFIRSTPTIASPEIRTLSVEESSELLKNLKVSDPTRYEKVMNSFKEWNGYSFDENGQRVSVSVFYLDLKTADARQAMVGTSDFFQEKLYAWATSKRRYILSNEPIPGGNETRNKDFARVSANRLKELWTGLSTEEQYAFRQDFNVLFPKRASDDADAFLPHFLNELPNIDTGVAAQLWWMQVERKIDLLPAALKSRLADYWATYTVLGIPDPHGANALVLEIEDLLLAVDVGHPPMKPTVQGKLWLPNQKHPFGKIPIDERILKKLLSHISPEMKQYLASLNRDTLKAIAAESGSTVTKKRANEILDTIRLLLKESASK